MTPSVYLISRKVTDEQARAIAEILSITPIDVAIIANPEDVSLARKFCEKVTGLHRPIAIVADFDSPFSAVQADGSVQPLSVDEAFLGTN